MLDEHNNKASGQTNLSDNSLTSFHIASQNTPNGLLPAEEKLLIASLQGEQCVIGDERPSEANEANKVRASFIRYLATSEERKQQIHARGIALKGAFIDADLDLTNCEVQRLSLLRCWINGTLYARDAKLNHLILNGSRIVGLVGWGLKNSGSLICQNGFLSEGGIDLLGSEINGDINFSGSQICKKSNVSDAARMEQLDPQRSQGIGRFKAVSCIRSKVQGSIYFRDGFEAEGRVDLRNADIGGSLDCTGGRFINRDDRAIHCGMIKVAGHILLRKGFVAEGEVSLFGAKVTGIVVCSGGYFSNRKARPDTFEIHNTDIPLADNAISFHRAELNYLNLGNHVDQKPPVIEGCVDFRAANIKILEDHNETWPAREATGWDGNALEYAFYLDGFVYKRLFGDSPLDVPSRLEWLKCQPSHHLKENFKPQPFEQLMRVLRDTGYEDEAREIAYYKQEHLTSARLFRSNKYQKPIVWLMRGIFDLAAGYGYRTHRLILAAVVLWLTASVFYWQAGKAGVIAPTNPVVYLEADLKQCQQNWTTCQHPKMVDEHTPFYPTLYALDVLLPIVPLGQDIAWAPMDKAWDLKFTKNVSVIIPSWVGLGLMWIEILFGWIVGLSLVAIFGGIVKRD